MSEKNPLPTEYGGNGDIARARRQRRAFHFTVAAITLFAATLLLSEDQLRHSGPENQFRNGLTMQEESGRVMLRQAVRMLENDGEEVPVHYLEALAQREQEDMILETFERAYTRSPESPDLNLRYGAALFEFDQFAAARERFADAALHAPENALPLYQQAAAVAVGVADQSTIPNAFEIVQRVDPSTQIVSFPIVLWFPELPRDSKGYQHWVAVSAARQCAPLVALARKTLDNVEVLVAERSAETVAEYIEQLEQMARHIYRAENLSTSSALTALAIEEIALNARVNLAAQYDTPVPPDASNRLAALRQSIDAVSQFDSEREEKMEAQQRWLVLPMYRILEALFLGSVIYVIVFWIYHLARFASGYEKAPPYAIVLFLFLSLPTIILAPIAAPIMSFLSISPPWTLRIPGWVRLPMIMGVVILCAMMFWFTATEPPSIQVDGDLARANLAWRAIYGLIMAWAFFTPYVWLPKAAPVDETDEAQKTVKPYRLWAASALGVRQVGFVLGLLVIVFSVWGVGTRLITGTYPHKYELIVSGKIAEEAEIIETHVRPLR